MNVWRIGSNWGSDNLLELFKEKKIAFAGLEVEDAIQQVKTSDVICITRGQSIEGIGVVSELKPLVEIDTETAEDYDKVTAIICSNVYWKSDYSNIDFKNYDGQGRQFHKCGEGCKEMILGILNNIMNNTTVDKYKDLLLYKKQIILQGPPGTGKTKLAKEIAENVILNFDIYRCLELLKVGYEFPLSSNDDIVSIKGIDNDLFILSRKVNGFDATFSKEDVLNCFLSKDYLSKKLTSRGKYVVRVLVSYWIANLNISSSNQNEYIKIVQFHPAYTYEDFVRGIVAKPNKEGDGIVYEAENKLLGNLAQVAHDNFIASQTDTIYTGVEMNVFDAFIERIKDEMALNDFHKYDITEAVYLFDADDTRFKYKGDNWKAHSKGLNMKFSELNKIIEAGAQDRQDIKKMPQLEELTRQHATYFMKVVELYYTFSTHYKGADPVTKPQLKNYVLIIDEINRANLSSVLGELIYALEYRGESVDTMYAIDGDHTIVLPPNLYIIGTMNTADRSVGYIDYAIRRRFAFVDVLPKDLSDENGIKFDSKLFHQVASIFDTNLSPEFEKKDVQLGHSYFMDKSEDGGSIAIRLQYEIKPILLEYVKDGVLVGENIENMIDELRKSL